jgi:hypothetical protein
MVARRRDFIVVFGAMQDHSAVPHNAVQYNYDVVPHGVMQKWLDCKKIAYPIYFPLKFPKRVNYSHFH